MAYVLRPHKGNDNLDGWDDSVKYDKTAIKSIEDPNGGAASIPITSIPSPFASMELVRNAFEYCADRNNSVDGTSVYHKLVSFALDILEIFYNYDKYAKDLDIIPWYKNDLDMYMMLCGCTHFEDVDRYSYITYGMWVNYIEEVMRDTLPTNRTYSFDDVDGAPYYVLRTFKK